MIWRYIKAEKFFADYLPHIKNFKRKISGKNGRGNFAEFSAVEKSEIKDALKKVLTDIQKNNEI